MINKMYYNEVYVSNNKFTYGSRNQFNVLLDRSISNVRAIRYVRSQIPKTFYGVNTFNNTIRIQENAGAAFTASVTPGNYTPADFITALKSSLDSNSTNGRIYTVSYSSSSNKITISINVGTFSILGDDPLSNGHLMIGFEALSTPQAVSHTGSLVQRIDTYPEELFIRGTFGQNTKSQVEGSSTSNNILVKIDTTSSERNAFINDYNYQEDVFLTDTIIDNIETYVTFNDINTGNSRLVDFNGGHFSYTVGLWNKFE